MTTPLTPRQVYDRARADTQKEHHYTTEGIHAVCSCGVIGTIDSIGDHIETLAEEAGRAARDAEIERRAQEYEANEKARKAREREANEKARARAEAALAAEEAQA